MIKTKINLGIVQETLLITLWARAKEQQQTDPIIQDPKSVEILNAIDYDFSKFVNSKNSQIGCCLRGMVLDNWVRDYLQLYPQGTVIEIGAGLNTRFERVDNGQVRWFDLDLPDSMALRQKFFTQTERRKFITASCLSTAWIKQVKAFVNQTCMFVAEGVLMYFNEQNVKQLFAKILQEFPNSWFAFDSMSPLMVKNQKLHDSIKHVSAKFAWGLSDIYKIQDWDSRYQVMEVCTFADLPARYLQRYSFIVRWLFSHVNILRNSYRLALVRLK